MTRTLYAALAATALLAGGANAQYVQLVDRDTINGGDGTTLISGTIVGTTGYAMLSGGGQHRIVQIDDIGGANTISTLVSTADLNTTLGTTPSGISGTLLASGGDLIILENTTDQVVTINQGTGASSLLLDDATIDALPGVSGSATVSFGDINPVSGNPVFYEGDTDSVYEVTGTNTVSLLLTDTELATITGDDTPGGLAIDTNGVFYFGQSTSVENVSFFDPAGPTSGTLFSEPDIQAVQGVAGDTGISSTAFTLVGNQVVFANTGTPDNFLAFDANPATAAATLELVIAENPLLAGPASSDAAIAFTSFDGEIAWVNLLNGGPNGAVAGFYVIPEPASVAILALVGLGLASRRRR